MPAHIQPVIDLVCPSSPSMYQLPLTFPPSLLLVHILLIFHPWDFICDNHNIPPRTITVYLKLLGLVIHNLLCLIHIILATLHMDFWFNNHGNPENFVHLLQKQFVVLSWVFEILSYLFCLWHPFHTNQTVNCNITISLYFFFKWLTIRVQSTFFYHVL